MNKKEIAKKRLEQVKVVKAKKREILSISNVPPVLHQAFSDLAISKKVTHNKLFAQVFYHYLNFPFELNNEESLIIQEANAIAPNSLGKKIKKMVLRYSEHLISLKDKPEAIVNTKIKNSAKAADARADALIEQIFNNNNNANHWYDKTLITKTSILDYASKQKATDPEAIVSGKLVLDRCIERHKEQIKRHHEEHKLTPNHNAIAHYERLKAIKGGKS
jgi:hypothetical protein